MYYDNKRLALSIFWIVLGAVLVWLSIAELIDATAYSGIGGALIAVGVVRIIMITRYRTNASYREKVDTQLSDERNDFLRMKSWTWTGYFVIIAEAIGSVIAMILGHHTLQLALSYNVCLMLIAYFVSYAILSRKY